MDMGNDDHFEALITYQDTSVTMQEIKFRAFEGVGGPLQIYVLPKTASKVAQMRTYEMPILSLYEKIANLSIVNDCSSELIITGNFTLTEATRWLRKLLADMPEAVSHSEVTLSFSSELGCSLNIIYKAGLLIARSESASTLEAIKETVSKEAGIQRALEFDLNLKQESVDFLLEKLDTRYTEVLSNTLNLQLIDAFSEMANYGELMNLSEENRQIYERREELLSNKEVNAGVLEYLQGVITDLFIDWKKANGTTHTRQEMIMLERHLMSYNLDSMIAFFHS